MLASISRRLLIAAFVLAASPAIAQKMTVLPQVSDEAGYSFGCADGSKLVLDLVESDNGVAAMVSVHGDTFRLPYITPEPGLVQVMWSDGERSLTWSPGVQLMWMARNTHLMCSRSGGHKH